MWRNKDTSVDKNGFDVKFHFSWLCARSKLIEWWGKNARGGKKTTRRKRRKRCVALRFSLRKCSVSCRLLDVDIVSRVSLCHTYTLPTHIHIFYAYRSRSVLSEKGSHEEPGRRLRPTHDVKPRGVLSYIKFLNEASLSKYSSGAVGTRS